MRHRFPRSAVHLHQIRKELVMSRTRSCSLVLAEALLTYAMCVSAVSGAGLEVS